MPVYKITLVPLERFFFGSDNTFGKDNQENYYVKSIYFPQQTTLLGTLRYLLLKRFNLMDVDGKITDKGKADKLIGEYGFSVKNAANDYGVIQNLSPLFITGPDSDYVVGSREYGLDWVEDEFSKEKRQEIIPLYYKKQKGVSRHLNNTNFIPYLTGITAKTVIPDLLINVNTNKQKHLCYNSLMSSDPQNGILIEDEQIGINKHQTKNALYKQIGLRLVDGYGFSFYAEFKENDKYKNDCFESFENMPIKMGSDQSWFMASMQLVENEESLSISDIYKKPLLQLFKYPNSSASKIVLLSDTYIEKKLFEQIDFAISDIYPFRFMTTQSESESNKTNSTAYHNKKGGYKTSKGKQNFELLKRGSVLFVNYSKKEAIIKEITGVGNNSANKYQAFNQIGYNYAI